MTLLRQRPIPHGMADAHSSTCSPRDTQVVFAFHGYQRAIHELVHGRPDADRFHVRGFNEEGTTTTPFDMVVRNGMSRSSRDRGAPPRPAVSSGRPRWFRNVTRC